MAWQVDGLATSCSWQFVAGVAGMSDPIKDCPWCAANDAPVRHSAHAAFWEALDRDFDSVTPYDEYPEPAEEPEKEEQVEADCLHRLPLGWEDGSIEFSCAYDWRRHQELIAWQQRELDARGWSGPFPTDELIRRTGDGTTAL